MVPRALDPTGVILVDKPAGPSSFKIVADVRRRTGARTGHTGTLDPFATGLLVLVSGRATRLAARFVGLDKRYVTALDLRARNGVQELSSASTIYVHSDATHHFTEEFTRIASRGDHQRTTRRLRCRENQRLRGRQPGVLAAKPARVCPLEGYLKQKPGPCQGVSFPSGRRRKRRGKQA